MEAASSLSLASRTLAVLLPALLTAGTFRALAPRIGRLLPGADLLLLSILSSFAAASLGGLGLALAGHFSLLSLSLVLTLAAVALHLLRQGSSPAGEKRQPSPALPLIAGSVLAAAAVFLYFRPSESIVGNWDPGVYLAQGSAIAADGGYRLVDRASPLLRPGEKEELYLWQRGFRVKYPGFFVSPDRPHRLDPQFYPLYPVWIAMAATFGTFRWALYLSGLFSLLSLVLVVRIGEETAGRIGAFAAGAIFLLNPVQIWFSGFHTAELLMQLLSLAGIWCWILWERHEKNLFSFLSGAFFALTAFASVTGVYLAALAGLLHLLQFRRKAGHPAFFLPLAAALPLLLVQNLFFTRQYFGQVLSFAPLFLKILPLLAVAGLPVVLLLLFRPRGFSPGGERGPSGHRRFAGTSFFFALLALLAYGLYGGGEVGRWLRDPALLVSKSNLIVAWAGLALLTRKRPRVGLMLGALFLLFTVVFLLHGMMVPRYPWAFKRFLPVTLPLLAVFAGSFWGLAAKGLPNRRLQALLLAAALLFTARPLIRGREFALHRDWKGAVEAVEAVAAALPVEGVVFAPKWIATPLEFLHGRKVVPIGGSGGMSAAASRLVSRLRGSGSDVYLVVQAKIAAGLPFDFKEVHRQALDTTVLSQSRRPFTTEIKRRSLRIVILRVR